MFENKSAPVSVIVVVLFLVPIGTRWGKITINIVLPPEFL
jgi:hypothetical protein